MCGPPPPGIHTFVFVLVPVVISPATAGIWAGVSATVSTPPFSPKRWLLSPSPCPGCIGTLPRMSGSWKFVLPSPPYVVPNRANRAAFDVIGMTCPLQYSQPSGSKFPPNMRMVAIKASIIETILRSEQLHCTRRVPQPCPDAQGVGATRANGARIYPFSGLFSFWVCTISCTKSSFLGFSLVFVTGSLVRALFFQKSPRLLTERSAH